MIAIYGHMITYSGSIIVQTQADSFNPRMRMRYMNQSDPVTFWCDLVLNLQSLLQDIQSLDLGKNKKNTW